MKDLTAGNKYLCLLALSCVMTFPYSCEKSEDPEIDTQLGTVTDYDGNSYYTIQLGDQRWMINNLRATHYADGTAIPLIENVSVWEALGYDEKAYCFYNNNENNEAQTYGALYTWEAAMNGAVSSDNKPSGVQGVCPDGWHLPSDNEWKELEIFLGMTQAEADLKGLRGTNEGSKLANSSDLWLDGYLVNDSAFGSTGFIAQPAGGRRYDGTFDHIGDNVNFWTATEHNNIRAWGRHIYSSYTSLHRYYNVKSDGFSVRCVKDD